MSWDTEGFREKLEAQHKFPGMYVFKFIVPVDAVSEVEQLWKQGKVMKRPSSKGNYVSVTIHADVEASKQVIDVYFAASKIEGCIAL